MLARRISLFGTGSTVDERENEDEMKEKRIKYEMVMEI